MSENNIWIDCMAINLIYLLIPTLLFVSNRIFIADFVAKWIYYYLGWIWAIYDSYVRHPQALWTTTKQLEVPYISQINAVTAIIPVECTSNATRRTGGGSSVVTTRKTYLKSRKFSLQNRNNVGIHDGNKLILIWAKYSINQSHSPLIPLIMRSVWGKYTLILSLISN